MGQAMSLSLLHKCGMSVHSREELPPGPAMIVLGVKIRALILAFDCPQTHKAFHQNERCKDLHGSFKSTCFQCLAGGKRGGKCSTWNAAGKQSHLMDEAAL